MEILVSANTIVKDLGIETDRSFYYIDEEISIIASWNIYTSDPDLKIEVIFFKENPDQFEYLYQIHQACFYKIECPIINQGNYLIQKNLTEILDPCCEYNSSNYWVMLIFCNNDTIINKINTSFQVSKYTPEFHNLEFQYSIESGQNLSILSNIVAKEKLNKNYPESQSILNVFYNSENIKKKLLFIDSNGTIQIEISKDEINHTGEIKLEIKLNETAEFYAKQINFSLNVYENFSNVVEEPIASIDNSEEKKIIIENKENNYFLIGSIIGIAIFSVIYQKKKKSGYILLKTIKI